MKGRLLAAFLNDNGTPATVGSVRRDHVEACIATEPAPLQRTGSAACPPRRPAGRPTGHARQPGPRVPRARQPGVPDQARSGAPGSLWPAASADQNRAEEFCRPACMPRQDAQGTGLALPVGRLGIVQNFLFPPSTCHGCSSVERGQRGILNLSVLTMSSIGQQPSPAGS